MVGSNKDSKRVTIMLENDLVKKLHTIQAKKIIETGASASFSQVLCDVLRKGLK